MSACLTTQNALYSTAFACVCGLAAVWEGYNVKTATNCDFFGYF